MKEKLSTLVTLYEWKIVPAYEFAGEDGRYVLTARRFENHPRLGDGEDFKSGWIVVIDLERGYAMTMSGTRYSLEDLS
tara:strand:+ start:130 stop:363 length:234 start_codon:yes stop_codon:yes gene_type:complete